MQRADFEPFVQLLVAEVEIRNGKPLSQAAIQLWWDRMAGYELQQVRRAFELYARDEAGRFMPQPSDLIRHIDGTTTDRALLAWGHVLGAIGAVGAYCDVDLGDPAAHAAIADMGGWPKVCRSELRELGFVQKRFTDAYRAYTERGVTDCPRVLMGDRSPDSEYEKKGLPLPKPRLVGAIPCALALENLQQRRLADGGGDLRAIAHEALKR